MSTVVRPLAWLPSSSRAPNVKLKPGPPAQPIPSRCPRRGPLPGTLAAAEPRAFPVRTGASSPCGTRVPLHAQPQQAGLTGTSAVGDQQAALRRGACAQPPTIELTPHMPWGAGREPGAGAGWVAWTNRTPSSAAE